MNVPDLGKKQPKQFSIKQLNDYILLTAHLTGGEITEIKADPEFLAWYKQQVDETMKSMGMEGKAPKELRFNGVIIK